MSAESVQSRVSTWRKAKRREVLPEEGVLIEHLTIRQHLWLAVLRTTQYRRWLISRFRRWAVMPGDAFYEMTTDRYYRIREVRHDHVLAEVFSGQVLWYIGRNRLRLDDPRIGRVVEQFPRPLSPYWWPTTDDKVPA